MNQDVDKVITEDIKSSKEVIQSKADACDGTVKLAGISLIGKNGTFYTGPRKLV